MNVFLQLNLLSLSIAVSSATAVRPLMNYFKIGIEDIVVLYDDMDLPVGKIRLRQKGSAGGHNGIKSIISCLGSDQFNRIKIGVGRPAPGRSVVNHVLKTVNLLV